jgi:beta-glucosidase
MKRFFPTIIASVVLALSLFSLSACTKAPVENPIDTLEERVAAMTLEEKLGQMVQAERNAINSSAVNALNLGSILSGGGSHPNPNTPQGWLTLTTSFRNASLNSSSGLPVLYGVDAVHGHNNLLGAVLFPHNIALGATRDADLVERIGTAVAIQLKATGVPWNFAPCVAVVQDLRWGRTYESFGENPELVSQLGVAYTLGLQAEGVAATAKHFIADGGTDFNANNGYPIDQGNVSVNEATIRDIHLPPYVALIDEADVLSVMVSFSSINGKKMHASKYWITEVLKGELGFEGLVVSDWEAIHQLPGSLLFQVSAAVNAGVDLLMEPFQYESVLAALKQGVDSNTIKLERIDDAVLRILKVKERLGLLDEPETAPSIDLAADQALAREAVAKSQVLLKNNGILPLAKNAKILLVGPGVDNIGLQAGGWSFSWQGESTSANFPNGTSILDAFTAVAEAHGGMITTDKSKINQVDVVVVVLAEKPYAEGIGDSPDLSLTGKMAHADNASALNIARLSKKPVVTLLMSGRPLLVSEELGHWDAFVMSWLFGTEASGVTDVLYGDVPFTGTLPVTWPKTAEANLTSSMLSDRDTSLIEFDYGFGLTD